MYLGAVTICSCAEMELSTLHKILYFKLEEISGELLLQKVIADCPGDFLWRLFVDSKVVEFGKFLRFRLREYGGKPLHCQIYPFDMAFPAIHEQDVRSYFSIVFITAVKPSNFLMFAQIFMEETQHLLTLVGAQEKRKQQFHE